MLHAYIEDVVASVSEIDSQELGKRSRVVNELAPTRRRIRGVNEGQRFGPSCCSPS